MQAPPTDRHAAERLAWLDGLRGLAILGVILFHAYVRWPEVVPFGDRFSGRWWVAYGWLGVQLFFLISGFVISMTLARCQSLAEFLLRRWWRLFPAMLLVSALIFATAGWVPERPAGQPAAKDLLPGLLFVEPGWIALLTGPTQGLLEGSFWSLFVEVKFYVVAGCAYFLAGRRGMIAVLLAGFALAVSSRVFAPLQPFVIFTGALHFGWFACGVLFHVHAQSGKRQHAWIAILVGVLAAAAEKGHQSYTSLFAVLPVAVFAGAACLPIVRRAVSCRPLLFLGFASYPLYLVHENLMVAAIVKLDAAVPGIPPALLPFGPMAAVILLGWLIAARLEPLTAQGLRAAFRALRALPTHVLARGGPQR